MTELDTLVNLAKEKSREIVESGQEHVPTALIYGEGLSIVQILGDKEAFKAGFTALLKKLHAVRYVFITEAWMTESLRPLREDIRVRDLPMDDREEALFIVAVEKGHKVKMIYAIIADTPSGRKLGEFSNSGGQMTGRMVVEDW